MKILVLSSHTTSLFWFRIDMMKSFVNAGCQVVAVGSEPEEKWKDKFEVHGIIYRSISVSRNGLNPLSDLNTFISIYSLLKKEKPNKIFVYQAKTIAYGCMAAALNGISEVYALVAGLGSVFRGDGKKNKIIRRIMSFLYKRAFNCCKLVFFQNVDDRNEFVDNKLVEKNKTFILNGSGVNLEVFKPVPLPKVPAFLFIGRLIRDKGVIEYLEACKIIKSKYNERVKCFLVGPYDTNPSALSSETLKRYIEDGIIEYYGEQNDVKPFIARCTTYVLPSYHEGTPKTVLEAMAMGRAIITSDAPGCRETVIDGMNGYLIPIKNIQILVERMLYLIENPEINERMAKCSYQMACDKYDVRKVNKKIMNLMNISNKTDIIV